MNRQELPIVVWCTGHREAGVALAMQPDLSQETYGNGKPHSANETYLPVEEKILRRSFRGGLKLLHILKYILLFST
jgi:hypothetical protein